MYLTVLSLRKMAEHLVDELVLDTGLASESAGNMLSGTCGPFDGHFRSKIVCPPTVIAIFAASVLLS
jgi:hypothetical protein